MLKVYTAYDLKTFKFFKEMTEAELMEYVSDHGFMYKGKSKGIRYYGNYKYNYVAVK